MLLALVPLGISVARDLRTARRESISIALLAMAGSLVLGQYLAGAVVGLMLSGGQALERYATLGRVASCPLCWRERHVWSIATRVARS